MATFPQPPANPNIPPPPDDFSLDSTPPAPITPPVPLPDIPPGTEGLTPPSQPTVFPLQPVAPPPPPPATVNPLEQPAPPPQVPAPAAPPPPPPPPATPPQTPPLATAPTSSRLPRFLVPVLIVAVILGIIAFIVLRFVLPRGETPTQEGTTPTPPTVTLTYYGLWEPASVMEPVLADFESKNPGIKVDYQLQQSADYRERLQTLLNQSTTPDVVRFHSTWIPMLISGLSPAPQNSLTATEINANFPPVVADLVVRAGQVYGAPTTLEGLGLFVNQSLLSTAQITPPRTWEDLRTAAKTLTQYDPNTNQISQAGVALGTTANVDHWPDIVSLMLLQNGVNMNTMTPDSRVTEALRYYTFFSKTDQVWNQNLPNSVQAFAQGKVAMIFAPSWQALTIKQLNPSLSFTVNPVPQLPDSPEVTWANFWIEGVPKNSKNQAEAWKLVQYLASSQAQQLIFENASKERGFGQAPANKALAATAAANPIVGPYVTGATNAKTFYTTSFTHDGDTGINTRLIKYLEDAVNSYLTGGGEQDIIPTLQAGFYQVLSQYNIVSPTPAPVQ